MHKFKSGYFEVILKKQAGGKLSIGKSTHKKILIGSHVRYQAYTYLFPLKTENEITSWKFGRGIFEFARVLGSWGPLFVLLKFGTAGAKNSFFIRIPRGFFWARSG